MNNIEKTQKMKVVQMWFFFKEVICRFKMWIFTGGRNGEMFASRNLVFTSWCGECLDMCQEGSHISPVTRWWFERCFIFTPNPCEMLKFDGCISFKMGWFLRQLGDDFPRFLWRSINTCHMHINHQPSCSFLGFSSTIHKNDPLGGLTPPRVGRFWGSSLHPKLTTT